jgi:small-conductance mechanosensitive channel
MMPDTQIENLLVELWKDLQDPDVVWQVGTLLLCLGIAWAAGHYLGLRRDAPPGVESRVARLGRGGLRRVAFPLIALSLVLVARSALRQWHHVNLLNLAVPLLISLAAIRIVVFGLRQAFVPSGWLAAFERTFALGVWMIVALHIVGLLPELIEWLESITFSVGKQSLSLWLVLQGIATVLGTLLVALWVSSIVEGRLMRTEGLDSNLRVVFLRLSKALLMMVAVLIGLPLVGIDLTTLSVFGGALGVGLGLGLQKIASNYVSGIILLLDRSIRIGDMIAVDTHRGKVTQITTRYTVVQGLNGVESIVPNELLVGSVVQNECYSHPRVSVGQSIPVGYGTDVERAMLILVEAAKGHWRVLKDPAPAAFLASFGDNGINLELGYWIADPENGTLGIKSDINRAVWREFGEAGIEVPFPHRELRLLSRSAAVIAVKESLPAVGRD